MSNNRSVLIAAGAAAMFERVVMFFTTWATPALKDGRKQVKKADTVAKMFAQEAGRSKATLFI